MTVQFMVPGSIIDYTQQFGRAGRDGAPAVSVLLVEPSVFQLIKKKVSTSIATELDSQQRSITVKTEEVDSAAILGKRKRQDDDQAQGLAEHVAEITDLRVPEADYGTLASDDVISMDEDIVEVLEACRDIDALDELDQAFDVDDELQYRKRMDQEMREVCNTDGCIQEVLDAYFENPQRVKRELCYL